MSAPRWVAYVNKSVLNRGTRYRTPPWAFRHYDGFGIARTDGFNRHWVRIVVAPGEYGFESGRRRYEVANPHIYFDEDASKMSVMIGSCFVGRSGLRSSSCAWT